MSGQQNRDTMDEAHRGGTLEEMSARGGTSIPSESGRQPVQPSNADEKASKAYLANTTNVELGGVADNVVGMPESVKDMGVAGEVTTGKGDQLPADVEYKNIGGDSTGGKHKGQSRHTKSAAAAASAGRRNIERSADNAADESGTWGK